MFFTPSNNDFNHKLQIFELGSLDEPEIRSVWQLSGFLLIKCSSYLEDKVLKHQWLRASVSCSESTFCRQTPVLQPEAFCCWFISQQLNNSCFNYDTGKIQKVKVQPQCGIKILCSRRGTQVFTSSLVLFMLCIRWLVQHHVIRLCVRRFIQ